MSEAPNPRLGHGGFLLCLESIFEKLTGQQLEYNTILGKPCLFTYRYTQVRFFSPTGQDRGLWEI